MRIWIINPFDDIPGEGKPQRFWTLASMLAERGHEVVWWSSDWSHRRKARRVAPGKELSGQVVEWGADSSADIAMATSPHLSRRTAEATERRNDSTTQPLPFQLRLVSTPPYRKNISFARIWNHRKFGQNLYREACVAINSGELVKPDVILASMPPMEGPIAALRLRKRYGCRVVTDIMDAWPETLLQALPSARMADGRWRMAKGEGWKVLGAGKLLSSLIIHLSSFILSPYYRMLRRACRESDAVSAQSNAFADYAKKHGAKGAVHVCYLGATDLGCCPISGGWGQPPSHVASREGDCPQSPRSLSSLDSHEGNAELPLRALQATTLNQQPSKLRLLYLGSMGRSYDLETLLAAVERINCDAIRVNLVFVGDGEQRAALEKRHVPHVSFTGFLSGDNLDAQLREADIGIVPFHPDSGVAVPYKVGEYLACGLPVLSTIDGELGALLREYKCGLVYRAGDVNSLSNSLSTYLEASESRLRQEREGAKACYAKFFNREQSYNIWCDWLCAWGLENK